MTKRTRSPEPRRPDPSRHHPFEATDDPGLAAMASGSPFTGTLVGNLSTTTGYLRSTRCALSGCGKPQDDPIHESAEG